MSVPAITIAEWMQAKRTEFTEFDQTVADYDVLRTDYDNYVTEHNNYYLESYSTFGMQNILSWTFGTGYYSVEEKVRPSVPITPSAYTGPEIYDSTTHSTTLGYL